MSETLKESLSAVVDGEADEFELRRVLDEINRDPELAKVWHKYHLIGSHLRADESTAVLATDTETQVMANQVWSLLEAEQPQAAGNLALDQDGLAQAAPAEFDVAPAVQAMVSETTSAPSRGWLTGVAVAAGVAFMVSAGFFLGRSAEPEVGVAQQTFELEGPQFEVRARVSPSDVQRANAYMLHHVQQTALNKPGVASFVKVVTFGSSNAPITTTTKTANE